MSTQALLDAIAAAPGDDAPRLVWADAVGGERGELVVLQCDLARGSLSPAEAGARRRRERELLAKHGAVWSGLAGLARDVDFRRGFVEAAMIDAAVFLELGSEIFEGAPLLRSVTLTALTEVAPSEVAGSMQVTSTLVPRLEQLIASPFVARLDALDFVGAGMRIESGGTQSFQGVGDGLAAVVARSGVLRHLRSFGIGFSQLGARGAHALLASGDLGELEQLWLREHQLGDDAVLALLAACPRLRGLDIVGRVNVGTIAAALPALHELRIGSVYGRALVSLATSRAAPSLEVLAIEYSKLDDSSVLEAFPRLRALDVKHVAFTPQELRVLARAQLPALRRVRLGTNQTADEIAAIAHAFGPQLETLDVRGANIGAQLASELKAIVAGELLTSMVEHVPTRML